MICTCQITAFGKVTNPECPECNSVAKSSGSEEVEGTIPATCVESAMEFSATHKLSGFWVLVQKPDGSTSPFYGRALPGDAQTPLVSVSSKIVTNEIEAEGYVQRYPTTRYFLCHSAEILGELGS